MSSKLMLALALVFLLGCQEGHEEVSKSLTGDNGVVDDGQNDDEISEGTDFGVFADEVEDDYQSPAGSSISEDWRLARFSRFMGLSLRAIVQLFDVNQSGDLQDQEKKAGRNVMLTCSIETREYLIDEYDQNSNGQLDKPERMQINQDLKSVYMELREEFDTNNDGQISKDEKEALLDHLSEMAIDIVLNRFDQNSDDLIDFNESQSSSSSICNLSLL